MMQLRGSVVNGFTHLADALDIPPPSSETSAAAKAALKDAWRSVSRSSEPMTSMSGEARTGRDRRLTRDDGRVRAAVDRATSATARAVQTVVEASQRAAALAVK